MSIAQFMLLFLAGAVLIIIFNPMTWGFFCLVAGMLIERWLATSK